MNDLSSSDQDVIQLSLEKGLVPLSMYRNDFDFFPRALALMQTYVYEDHLETRNRSGSGITGNGIHSAHRRLV